MPDSTKIIVQNVQRLWAEDRRKRPRDSAQGVQNIVNEIKDGDINVSPIKTYAEVIGDGVASTYTVAHELNVRNLQVQVWVMAGEPGELVNPTVEFVNRNVVRVTFSDAAPERGYLVVILGFVQDADGDITPPPPEPTPEPEPGPESESYPYVLYSETDVTRTGASSYTYDASRLYFATRRDGTWATVMLDDVVGDSQAIGAANNGAEFCAVSWLEEKGDHLPVYRSTDEGQTWAELTTIDTNGYSWWPYFITYACGHWVMGSGGFDGFRISTDMVSWARFALPDLPSGNKSASANVLIDWIAVDEQGALHVLYFNSARAWFYTKTSDLVSWSTPVAMWGGIETSPERGQNLVVHGEHLWAVHLDWAGGDILMQTSHDRGDTWGASFALGRDAIIGETVGWLADTISPNRYTSSVLRGGDLYVSFSVSTGGGSGGSWDARLVSLRCTDPYTALSAWSSSNHRPVETVYAQSTISAGGAGEGYVMFVDWIRNDEQWSLVYGDPVGELLIFDPATGARDVFYAGDAPVFNPSIAIGETGQVISRYLHISCYREYS